MSESVARRLAAPHWLLNTPPLTAWLNGEWADSTGKQTEFKIWTRAVDSGSCSRVRCTQPHLHSVEQGIGKVVQGWAYRRVSLRAAEYDHHSSRMSAFNPFSTRPHQNAFWYNHSWLGFLKILNYVPREREKFSAKNDPPPFVTVKCCDGS